MLTKTKVHNIRGKNGQKTRTGISMKINHYSQKKSLKRYSTSVVIREMYIKTTVRYHFMTTRWAKIKASEPKASENKNPREYTNAADEIGNGYINSWDKLLHLPALTSGSIPHFRKRKSCTHSL